MDFIDRVAVTTLEYKKTSIKVNKTVKKLLIILLFASLNVSASDWIEMGTLTSGSIFYLDKSSIAFCTSSLSV